MSQGTLIPLSRLSQVSDKTHWPIVVLPSSKTCERFNRALDVDKRLDMDFYMENYIIVGVFSAGIQVEKN